LKARIIIAIVACAAALGVAGCGDDDDETTTPTTTEATTATGATGAEGDTTTGEEAPEGTADVQSLLETAFAAGGFSEGEAQCVAEIVAPEVSGEQLSDVQDPSFIQDLLADQEDAINDCEGE
jgi:hypothetical protein